MHALHAVSTVVPSGSSGNDRGGGPHDWRMVGGRARPCFSRSSGGVISFSLILLHAGQPALRLLVQGSTRRCALRLILQGGVGRWCRIVGSTPSSLFMHHGTPRFTRSVHWGGCPPPDPVPTLHSISLYHKQGTPIGTPMFSAPSQVHK